MATIGIIGAGHIGRSFSKAAISAGHTVVISNSRGPDSLGSLVEELGVGARAATAEEAAAIGDFALVAIPLPATEGVPVEPLAGKIVLDSCNYFPERLGHVAAIDRGETTVPELLQWHLPSSKVARAFNHLDAAAISTDGMPADSPNRRALGFAADDAGAKRLVSNLYESFGFDAVEVGGLADAWKLDADQPAFVVRQNAAQLRANLDTARRHVI
jgi:predicted dinucleotide-binding enzyme